MRTDERQQRSDGKMERSSGRTSSYQKEVGIDGEAMEFEWKKFPGFSSLSILQRSRKTWREKTLNQKGSRTGSSLCQCSMTLIGQIERMVRLVLRMPRKSKIRL